MSTDPRALAAAAAAVTLALSAPAALAQAAMQESGFYLGGSLGHAEAQNWCTPRDLPAGVTVAACDDTDSAWKLFAGYRFNRHFALEGARLQLGDVSATVNIAGTPVSVTTAQHAWSLAVVGIFPVGARWALFGKVGRAESDQEALPEAGGTRVKLGEDGTDWHIGAGAQWQLARNWVVRAEWERLNTTRIELISVGVQYGF